MKLYIARDIDGKLFLYNYLPIKDEKLGIFKLNGEIRESNICFDIFNLDSKLFPEIKDNSFGVFQADGGYDEIEINPDLHPEVTWENSPQRVELKLIKNDSNS